jgi:sugar/nucleoside kinase (ribokinase family)
VPRIVCIGIPIRDLKFRIGGTVMLGSKTPASHFDEICGGNGLNAAIAVARLGGQAALTGPIGDSSETASRVIFDLLGREGVDTSHLVHMPGLATSASAILIHPDGERSNVTFRDPRLWTARLPDPGILLDDCSAVLAESRCSGFAAELCAEARVRGIPVVIDIDSPMALDDRLLTASSHLIFSSEALRASAGMSDDAAALRKIAGLTPAFLAATRGPRGTIWLDGAQTLRQTPAFPVQAVDSLGAGDVFHGAFALALTEGQDLSGALSFASAAAALKCTRHGGALGCPQRAELEAFLRESKVLGVDRGSGSLP